MEAKKQRVQHYLDIMGEIGNKPEEGACVLDFGCGNGDVVAAYRSKGYQAFGCDMAFKEGRNVRSLEEQGFIRLIPTTSYRLPFDDGVFDVLVSDQVLEHVLDYPSALKEMHRVLKDDGFCLHLFPSRYKLIEPHIFVPLATVVQKYWWLRLWAGMGVRKKEQSGLPPGKVAALNYEYLKTSTNYLSKTEINNHIGGYFHEIKYCESEFLKYSNRGRVVYQISWLLPFLPRLYSGLFSRVIYFAK